MDQANAEFTVELFYDHEVDQWGYEVDQLNILGTGCRSREAAQSYAEEAIRFALEEEPLANG